MTSLLDFLIHQHDPLRLSAAILVSIVGSFLSVQLFRRFMESTSKVAIHWLMLSSLIAGSSIWAAHFVAVLAYQSIGAVAFLVTPTQISLLVPILLTAVALGIYRAQLFGDMWILPGLAFGAAISTMHYTGMKGMVLSRGMAHDHTLVVLSVLCALLGSMATFRAFSRRTRTGERAAVALMVASVLSLHLVGMASIQEGVGPQQALPSGLDPSELLYPVILVIALMLMSGISTYMIDDMTVRESRQRVETVVRQDPLTGLANRYRAHEHLDHLIGSPEAVEQGFVIAAVDVMQFKHVNDRFGQTTGDDVLLEIGQRLALLAPVGGLAARVGADDFLLIVEGIRTEAQARKLGDRIVREVGAAIRLAGQMQRLDLNVGLILCPRHGVDRAQLLAGAELAQAQSNLAGRGGYRIFDADLAQSDQRRKRLVEDLRTAIERGELDMYLQVQMDTERDAVIGFESLMRWHHPEFGVVSPGEFIPLAEAHGMIVDMGNWMIEAACAEASQWMRPYTISVNVAAEQLLDGDLDDVVAHALQRHGLQAKRLELEITESSLIADHDVAFRILTQLKEMGVSIAMDDYGTGYSSLSMLNSFPFDKIKIDRSFVWNLDTDPQALGIVRATVVLGEALGMTVLAEGAEAREHISELAAAGCYQVQGYVYGKPMPADQARATYHLMETTRERWDADTAREEAETRMEQPPARQA